MKGNKPEEISQVIKESMGGGTTNFSYVSYATYTYISSKNSEIYEGKKLF